MISRISNVTAVMLLVLTSGTAMGQDRSQPTANQPAGSPTGSMASEYASDRSPRLIPAEWVIGQRVLDSDRHRLGRVKDLILDAGDGHVEYALVDRAAREGAIAAVVAVPWLAFTWDSTERSVVLPVMRDRLAEAKPFDQKRWDLLGDRTWMQDVYGFFNVDQDAYQRGWKTGDDKMDDRRTDQDRNRPAPPATGGDRNDRNNTGDRNGNDKNDKNDMGDKADSGRNSGGPAHYVLASKIKGQTLRGAEDKEIGDVDELVFDGASGRMAFIVAQFGGFLGIGDSKVAVPWDYFKVNEDGHLYTNEVKADEVRTAPRLDRADWSELRDPQYGPRVYQHFGRDAAWFGTGFQSGRSGEMGMGVPADDYKNLYSSGSASEVSGTVTRVSQEEPINGAGPVQTVVIRTDSGERLVHLAPAAYLHDQGCTLKEGDRVTISGRTANVGGKQVVIATNVKGPDGKTVDLRDSQGSARWSDHR